MSIIRISKFTLGPWSIVLPKDNISKFLHRDLTFPINSYVTMLISLLIPAHGQLSNGEHTDLILLILLIWGKIPYWHVPT